MIVDTLHVGEMQVNCYVVGSEISHRAVIIDPGADYQKIQESLKKHGLSPLCIIITHGHYDHIGALDRFRLPVYIHKLDAEFLEDPEKNLSAFFGITKQFDLEIKPLEDRDTITIDDINLEVIHTPGHTPGGISLYVDKMLFTGDTLFAGGVGRTDLPDASDEQLRASLQKLLAYDDDTKVLPGHGPSTTVGREKKINPFL
ncbi:MBL fold metallo-hydrolase [Candidatus Omnitrophota bacterium]